MVRRHKRNRRSKSQLQNVQNPESQQMDSKSVETTTHEGITSTAEFTNQPSEPKTSNMGQRRKKKRRSKNKPQDAPNPESQQTASKSVETTTQEGITSTAGFTNQPSETKTSNMGRRRKKNRRSKQKPQNVPNPESQQTDSKSAETTTQEGITSTPGFTNQPSEIKTSKMGRRRRKNRRSKSQLQNVLNSESQQTDSKSVETTTQEGITSMAGFTNQPSEIKTSKMGRRRRKNRRSKSQLQNFLNSESQQTDSKSVETTTQERITSTAQFTNQPSLPGPSGIAHEFQSSDDPKALNDDIGEASFLLIDDTTQDLQSPESPKAIDDETGEASCLPIDDKTDDEGSYTKAPVDDLPVYDLPLKPDEDSCDNPPEGEGILMDQPVRNYNEERSHSSNSSSTTCDALLLGETKIPERDEIQPTAKDDTISQEDSCKMSVFSDTLISDEIQPAEPIIAVDQTTSNDQEQKATELEEKTDHPAHSVVSDEVKVTEGQGNTTPDTLENRASICDDTLLDKETEVIKPTMQDEEEPGKICDDMVPHQETEVIKPTMQDEEELGKICDDMVRHEETQVVKPTIQDEEEPGKICYDTVLHEEIEVIKPTMQDEDIQQITDVTDNLVSGAELIIVATSDQITSDLLPPKETESPQDSIKIEQEINDVQEEKVVLEDSQEGVSQVEINCNQPTNDQSDANPSSLYLEEANSEPISDVIAKQDSVEAAGDSYAVPRQEVSAPEVVSGEGSREADGIAIGGTPEQIEGLPNEVGTSRGKKRKHKERRSKKHSSRKLNRYDDTPDVGSYFIVDTTSTLLMENKNTEYTEYPVGISGIEHLSVPDDACATLVPYRESFIPEPQYVEKNKPSSGIDYAMYYAAFEEEEYTLNYEDTMPTVSHYEKPPRRPIKIEAPPEEDKKPEKYFKSQALDTDNVDTDNVKDKDEDSVIPEADKSDVAPIDTVLVDNMPLMHPSEVCPIFVRLPEIARRNKYPVYTTLPIGVCDTCHSSKAALTRMRYTNKNMHRMMKVPGVGEYNRLVFAGNKENLSCGDTKKNPIPAPEIDDDVIKDTDSHWEGDERYIPAPLMRAPQYPGRPMPPVFWPPPPYARPYMPFPRMPPMPYLPYPYVRFNYPPPIPLFIPPQAFPRPPMFRPPPGAFFNIPPYPHNIFFPRESQNATVNRPKMTQNTSLRRPQTGPRPKTYRNTGTKPKIPSVEEQSDSPKAPVTGEFWIKTDKPTNTIPPFGNTKSPTAVNKGDVPAGPDEGLMQVQYNLPEEIRRPPRRRKHGRRKKSRMFTEVVSPAQVSVPYESIPRPHMSQQSQYVMPYTEMVHDSRDDYYQYRTDALSPVYEDEVELSAYNPEDEETQEHFQAADGAANSASGSPISTGNHENIQGNIPEYSEEPAANKQPQEPGSL